MGAEKVRAPKTMAEGGLEASGNSSCDEDGEEVSSNPIKVDDYVQASMKRVLTNNDLWSVGSATHGIGRCKPCNFFHSRGGCTMAADCPFCHTWDWSLQALQFLSQQRRLHDG